MKKRVTPLVTGLLVALVIGACGGCVARKQQPIRFTETRAPLTPDAVTVYTDPPARFQVVARIQSTAISLLEAPAAARQRAREDLVRQAAELGANGLVLEPSLVSPNADEALSASEVEGLAIFVPAE